MSPQRAGGAARSFCRSRPAASARNAARRAGIITILIAVILRFGLLASVATLVTHFILFRAPLTTDLNTWRGPLGLWYLAVVAVMGSGGCYIARASTQHTGG